MLPSQLANVGRFRAVLLASALSFIAFASCTDQEGNNPSGPGGATGFRLLPRFTSLGGSYTSAPIVTIRLTARNVSNNAVVATRTVSVSPDDDNWDVGLEVPADAGRVIVLIELLNSSNGVEWSGETAPITITPGVTPAPQAVEVFPGPPSNLLVTSIVASAASTTVQEGGTTQMSATVTPSTVAARVIWSSLDPAVATVEQNGLVSVLRDGTARIVGQAGARADTVAITATQRPATIEVTPDTLRLTSLQAEFTANARVLDPRGTAIQAATVIWTTGNPSVVEHLGAGRFRTRANGTSSITATHAGSPGISGSAVIVVAQRAGRVTVTPATVTLSAVGATQTFAAAVADANGNAMLAPVAWRSTNPAVATIDDNGVARAVAAGSTQIVAVANSGTPDSVTSVATLQVLQAVHSIAISPTGKAFDAVGDTARFTATARDVNNNVVIGAAFEWSSSNNPVAAVDSTGLVHAVSNGVAQITAAIGVIRTAVSVTVAQRANRVDVSPVTALLNSVGQTVQLTANARDRNGNPIIGAPVTWSSGDVGIATVDQSGRVTAVANGSVVIRAAVDDTAGIATVVVQQSQTSVAILPTADTVAVNDTARFAATARDGNGVVVPNVTFAYTVGDTSIATVDATGLARGKRPGTTTVTATREGASAHATLLVVANAPNNIARVSGNAQTAQVGTTLPDTLHVHVADEFGNPFAGASVQWVLTKGNGAITPSSSVTDAAGIARAVWTLGTSSTSGQEVEARATGLIGSPVIFTATATAGPVARVVISPDTLRLSAIGDTSRFAVATFDQFENIAVANPTWLSTDNNVVVVDAAGKVTARATGTAGIIASVNPADTAYVVVAQSAQSIRILERSDTLNALGDTVALSAEVRDSRNVLVTGATVTWVSRQPGTVSVDANGKAVSHAPGSATIVATSSLVSDSVEVVSRQVPASLTLLPVTDTLALGDSLQLSVTAADSNGAAIPGARASIHSSGPGVLVVDTASLMAYAAAIGDAAVIASLDGVADTSRIHIAAANLVVGRITVVPVDTLREGDSLSVSLTVKNTGNAAASASSTSVYILDAGSLGIVSHSDTTLVTPALNAGDSTVLTIRGVADDFLGWPDSVRIGAHADADDALFEADETDNAGMSAVLQLVFGVSSISFSDGYLQFSSIGDTARITATPHDVNSRALNVPVTYRSGDSSIIRVDSTGLVLAVGPGPTTLYATAQAKTDSIAVLVEQVATRIEISPDSAVLNALGDTIQYSARIYDARGNTIARVAQVHSLDPNIASPIDTVPRVVGHAVGTTRIVAETWGCSNCSTLADTVVLTVRQIVASLQVIPDSLTLFMGDTARLVALANDSNSINVGNASFAWSSSDTTVAVVDSTGKVTARAVPNGSVYITAAHAAYRDSALIRVSGPNGITKIWRGNSSDWGLASNWSPAALPTITDTVLIPATAPFAPVLGANAQTGGLVIDAGTSTDIGNYTLGIYGSLDAAGSIIGTGLVELRGSTGSLRIAALPNLAVHGIISLLSSTTVTGNLDIAGQLDVGANAVLLTGNLATSGNGLLVMTNAVGVLEVRGAATFAGGTYSSQLAAGLLKIRGNFYQAGSCNTSRFLATGSHTVELHGTAQTIKFDCAGTESYRSHFHNLLVSDSTTATLLSDVHATGDGTVNGTVTGNFAVVVGGDVTAPAGAKLSTGSLYIGGLLSASAATYDVGTTVFIGSNQTIGAGVTYKGVSVTGIASLAGNTQFNGDLAINGRLDVGAHSLTTTGSLSTSGNGLLVMTNAAGVMEVRGAATFAGGSYSSELSAGLLKVGGNFYQSGSCNTTRFQASGSHTVELHGTAQTVKFDCAGSEPYRSHFQNLNVSDSTTATLLTDAHALGSSTVNGKMTGNFALVVGGNVTARAGAELSTGSLYIGGLMSASAATYDVGNTVFTGSNQTIGAGLNYKAVSVTGTASLGGNTQFNGDLAISGQLAVGAHTLIATGGLSTSGNGLLVMTNAAGVMEVRGAATFAGGSYSSELSAGLLKVGGNFYQSGSCNTTRFLASGSHTVELHGTTQTVKFDCAGSEPYRSHFQNLNVSDSTSVTLLTDAHALGSSAVNGTATGNFALVVAGNVTAPAGAALSTGSLYIGGLMSASAATYNVGTTVFTGSNQMIGAGLNYKAVSVTGTAGLSGNTQFNGDLAISGQLTVGVHSLIATGSLSTSGNGLVVMTDSAGVLDVRGAATFAGGSYSSQLSAGLLKVGGDFYQSGSCNTTRFLASGSHTVELHGTAQTVKFDCAGSEPYRSHFQNLNVSDSTTATLLTDAHALGSSTVNGTVTGNFALVVGGNVTAPAGASLSTASLYVGGLMSASAATYNVGTTIFTGSSQTIGAGLNYKAVAVTGTAALSGNTQFNGDLAVSGQLTVGTHTLTATGSLSTSGNGLLIMTDSAGVLDVRGGATFAGGNYSSQLSAGLLKIGGNFYQAGSCNTARFRATGAHMVLLQGAAQTVKFDCGGNQTYQSHFQNLQVSDSTTATLLSAVYANGTLSISTRAIIDGGGNSLIVSGVNAAGGTLRNVPLNVTGGITQLDNVTFDSFSPTVTQLTVAVPSGTVTVNNLVFNTAPSSGLYVQVNGAGTLHMIGTTPTAHGGSVAGNITGWSSVPSGFTHVWTGTTSTSWNTTSNWSPATIPGATDDVWIRAGRPNQPALAANTSVDRLLIEPATTLTIGSFTLTTTGELSGGGTIAGSGKVVLAGTQTVSHIALPIVESTGAPVTSGNVSIAGSLTFGTGSFEVGSGVVSVTGALSRNGAGQLIMQNAAGELNVAGDVSLNSGNSAGLLTAGILRVGGHFTAGSSTAEGFAPSLNHKVVFNGSALQNVNFQHPGVGANRQHFQHLEVNNSAGVHFLNTAYVNGDVTILNGNVTSTSSRVHLGGSLVDGVGNRWRATNTTLFGTAPLLPSAMQTNLFFDWTALLTTALQNDLTVNGNLTVSNLQALNVNGRNLVVQGALSVQNGEFRMTQAADRVTVTGDVVFNAGSSVGELTDGVLTIGGHFTAGSSTAEGFAPSLNHKVVFNGSASQNVNFQHPGPDSTRQHFRHLEVNNSAGVHFLNTAYVNGDVAILNGNVTSSSARVYLGGDLVDSIGNRWRATNTTLFATAPALPSAIQTNLFFDWTALLTTALQNNLTVNGNLTVSNLHALKVNGRNLVVQGALSVQNGEFRMTQAADRVTVTGDVVFNAGSSVGELTEGVLAIAGHFTAGSSTAEGFAPSLNHKVIFNGSALQNVNFQHPGADSTRQHFRHLEVNNSAGVHFLNTAYVNGDVAILNGNVTSTTARVHLGGNLVDSIGNRWRATNTTLFAPSPILPSAMQTNLLLDWGAALTTALQNALTVTGSLTIGSAQALSVNGHSLTVQGGLTVQNGEFRMMQAADRVTVTGDVVFNGGNTVGELTDGILTIGGHFTAGSSTAQAFAPSLNHKVVFNGSALQEINFQHPGAAANRQHFNHVEIRTRLSDVTAGTGATFLNPAFVNGNLNLVGRMDLGAVRLTIGGDFIRRSTSKLVNGGTIAVGGTTTVEPGAQ